VRGTAENPMTREEVAAKCQDLVAPVLGAQQASALVKQALDIEHAADVRALRPLLQRAS